MRIIKSITRDIKFVLCSIEIDRGLKQRNGCARPPLSALLIQWLFRFVSYISVNWSLIFLPFFPRYLCAKHRSGNPLTLVANDMWNVEVDAEQSIYWFIIIIDIANAHDPTISINRSTSLIDDQRFSQLWIQIVHTQKSRWCEHQMKIYLLKMLHFLIA